jgi:hypothetical protein
MANMLMHTALALLIVLLCALCSVATAGGVPDCCFIWGLGGPKLHTDSGGVVCCSRTELTLLPMLCGTPLDPHVWLPGQRLPRLRGLRRSTARTPTQYPEPHHMPQTMNPTQLQGALPWHPVWRPAT